MEKFIAIAAGAIIGILVYYLTKNVSLALESTGVFYLAALVAK